MATGDVTLSITIEGGTTKSVVIDSATREKAKLQIANDTNGLSVDANWQLYFINDLASRIVIDANNRIETEQNFTKKTFTAAT